MGEVGADLGFHLGRNDAELMAVIGVARQRLHVGDELAAAGVMKRRRHGDLDAELVGSMRLVPRVKPEARLLPMHSTSGASSE